MAYFSKETELLAFSQLSELSADPLKQGATQKVSAIRHALALDEFYKYHGRDCDTMDRDDSREFEEYVGNVVALYDGFYTPNFYSIKKHDGDFCVRSNFYSAGAVKDSKINGGEDVEYPRRGWAVVLIANNGSLVWDSDFISNVKEYLNKDAYRVALSIWLLRNCATIDCENIYLSVRNELTRCHSQNLVDAILPSQDKFMDIYNLYYPSDLSSAKCIFNSKDFDRQDNVSYNTVYANDPVLSDVQEEYDAGVEEVDNIYTKADFLKEAFISGDEYDEIINLLSRKNNIILQGAPGVGKTFIARKLAYSIMGHVDESKVEFVQFHQSYAYEDFVVGYKPTEDGFKLETGPFYDFCKKAKTGKGQYFFIVDEINRGNLSRIFGELLMLIENSKRGDSATLLYTKEPFSVPNNLYIVGLMNTADRSLAMIDYALRRRFSFYTLNPCFEKPSFQRQIKEINNTKAESLIKTIIELNKDIENDGNLGRGFKIGHSYLCVKNASDCTLRTIVQYEIVPLLEEYWYDEPSKVEKWSQELLSALR